MAPEPGPPSTLPDAAWVELSAAIEAGEHPAWASLRSPDLAARWAEMEHYPEASLGYRVTCLYRARGFHYPGTEGGANPFLAQHDFIHVLGDFGTVLANELEVFALTAAAGRCPATFAMIWHLFETGSLPTGAGLFEASPGHFSRDPEAMGTRLADAFARGARIARLNGGELDLLRVPWLDLASLPVDLLRETFGFRPPSAAAREAGCCSAWEPGGISPFQLEHGDPAHQPRPDPEEPETT